MSEIFTYEHARVEAEAKYIIDKHQKASLGYRIIPTGIDSMDNAIGGGLLRASVNYIKGVPCIGRMSLILNILANQISGGYPPVSVVFALGEERSAKNILERLLCIHANVSSCKDSAFCAEEILRVKGSALAFSKATISFVFPTSLQELRKDCLQTAPDFIVVDSLDNFGDSSAAMLNTIAKECDAVVLVVSKLPNDISELCEHCTAQELFKVLNATEPEALSYSGNQMVVFRKDYYHLAADTEAELRDIYLFLHSNMDPEDSAKLTLTRNWKTERIIDTASEE